MEGRRRGREEIRPLCTCIMVNGKDKCSNLYIAHKRERKKEREREAESKRNGESEDALLKSTSDTCDIYMY